MTQQVYVMEGSDRLKVGRSKHVFVRKAQHELGKQPLRLAFATMPNIRAKDIERIACRILRNEGHTISGEWFAVDVARAIQAVMEAERIVRLGLPEPLVVRRPRKPPRGLLAMRLDEDLKASLQRLADADNRSLTNYIETVLRQHVAEADRNTRRGK